MWAAHEASLLGLEASNEPEFPRMQEQAQRRGAVQGHPQAKWRLRGERPAEAEPDTASDRDYEEQQKEKPPGRKRPAVAALVSCLAPLRSPSPAEERGVGLAER